MIKLLCVYRLLKAIKPSYVSELCVNCRPLQVQEVTEILCEQAVAGCFSETTWKLKLESTNDNIF